MKTVANETITLGYACDTAGQSTGSSDGPAAFIASLSQTPHHTMFYPLPSARQLAATNCIHDINQRLATTTQHLVQQKQPFQVIGGDHSCAIGTWSGAACALRAEGDLGLIWIDAHMDSHTPQTSPSGNLHGMPLACLFGYGDPKLTRLLDEHAKLKPENVCLLGIRCYEPGESQLLQDLNVQVYFMEEITERGFTAVLTEAIGQVSKNTAGYGISIDLDGIDPQQAPGVDCPEPNGIDGRELSECLRKLTQATPSPIGVEITEFNPHRDVDNKTLTLLQEIWHATQ